VLLLIALAWVLATAAGGIFDLANTDSHKHRVLLLHLSRDDWPVYLSTYLDSPPLLRFYLGYYMVPGLVGKWLGVSALNWAVPLWTWCGTALALQLFTQGHRNWKALAAAPILIFFGMTVGLIPVWDIDLDYSVYKRFAYAPQHVISAVLYLLLLIQLRRHVQFLSISGVVIATSLFWSTFIAIGLLPLVGVLILRNGVRPFLRWQNLLVAPSLSALFILYLSSGINNLARGWLWEMHSTQHVAATISYIITLVLLTLLIVILRPHLRYDPMFLVFPALMPVSLLFSFGRGNDWARYVILIAVIVLCFYGAKTVVRGWGNYHNWYRRVTIAAIIMIVTIGSISPFLRYSIPAFKSHDFRVFRYERVRDHSTLYTAIRPVISDQYAAPVSAWLQLLLQDPQHTVSSKEGILIIESDYRVYLENNRLTYIQLNCEQEEIESRFILHVIPVDKTILNGGEHANKDFNFAWNGMRVVDTCIVVRDLPAWEIASFKTGQYIGGRNSAGHKWLATYTMPTH
jgi:hypothetical protein